MDNCVDVVRDRSGQDAINILGYCMGGTMSVKYTALHKEKVNTLGLMAAGLCFDHTGGVLEEWGSEEYYSPQDVVDTFGNVPADMLDIGFARWTPSKTTSRSTSGSRRTWRTRASSRTSAAGAVAR